MAKSKYSGPIIRNFYTDNFTPKKESKPIYMTYECYLYKEITKGSFPKYKVLCNDKIKLYEKIDQLEQKYDLRTVTEAVSKVVDELDPIYDTPVIIDPNTGEFIDE